MPIWKKTLQVQASWIYQTLFVVIALWLFWLGYSQGLLQWKVRVPFPTWDMIAIESYLDSHPSPSLLELYRDIRDNEHRPIVTFFFYIIDRNFFGDDSSFLYPCIFACEGILMSSFLLPISNLRREIKFGSVALFTSTIVYLFFSGIHYENLWWQKQIHELSSLFFVSLAVFFATLVSGEEDSLRVIWRDNLFAAASGFLCVLASYSFGFGLVAWIVIGCHAVIRRWNLVAVLIFGTLAVSTILSYAFTYSPLAQHSDLSNTFLEPIQIFGYAMKILGALPATFHPIPAIIISILGVFFGTAQIFKTYFSADQNDIPRSRKSISQYSAMMFVASFGMALMTGIGRVTVNSGFDSRYAVLGSLYWASLLSLILTNSTQKKSTFYVLLFGLVTAFAGTTIDDDIQNRIRDGQQYKYMAGTLATLNLFYWPELVALYPAPNPIQEVWTRQRFPALSFAERAPFGYIGKVIKDSSESSATTKCFGYIDDLGTIKSAPAVIIATGWAFIASDVSRLKWIIISDESNTVRGAGLASIKRPDVRAAYEKLGESRAATDQLYSGFKIIAATKPGQKLKLWGVDEAGSICKIVER
jgi:hypothetical protein